MNKSTFEWKQFGEVADLITDYVANGSFASLKENVTYNYEKDYAILVRTRDYTKKFKGHFVYINEKSHNFLAKTHLTEGDLIMCNVGSVGVIFQVPDLGQPMNLGPNSVMIRTNKMNKFYYYWFKSPIGQRELLNIAGKTAQLKFNKTDLRKMKVPVPTESQNKKIVSILERAEKLKEKREEANNKTNKTVISLFVKMFGTPFVNNKKWKQKAIGDTIEVCQYGLSKKSSDNGIIMLGMNAINYDGSSDFTKHSYIELTEDEIKKFKLQKGDILFNRTNAANLVGKTGLFDENIQCVFASYLIRVRTNSSILLPEVLWVYMNTPQLKKKLLSMCKRAVSQANINAQELKSIEIFLPPIEKQKEFVRIISAIKKIQMNQEETTKETNKIFDSLMQKAFSGELVA